MTPVGAALTTPSQSPQANAAAPNPLAPLTAQQIQQQASKTVTASYQPAYQNLNQQQTQANNIAAKREADNKYYLAWLDTQGQALQAHADAANQTLDNLEQQLSGQQTSQMAALPGQLVAGANARAGNVSNEGNANAFGRYLAPQIQANEQSLHGAAAGALAATGNTTDMLGSARANSAGFVEAGDQKDMGALNTALTNIANQRSKLQSSETGDIGKEIARLQGVEVAKAEYNQNYATAAQKLGITLANTNSEIQSRNSTNADRAFNANPNAVGSAAWSKVAGQAAKDQTYQLNLQKYNSATAKDLYLRQHGLGPYKPSTAGIQKPLAQSSQNTIYSHISSIQGQLRQLETTYNQTPQQAYHVLLNGSTEQLSTKNAKGATVYYNTKHYTAPDVQLLNAAYNIATGNGLTKGDVAALEAMGIPNPGTRLKIGTPQPPSSGPNASNPGTQR